MGTLKIYLSSETIKPESVITVPAPIIGVIGSERNVAEKTIVTTGMRYMYTLVFIAPSLFTE